ncbi:hypothetical protein [Thalassospira sp. A3_1]|uniref:hypothetical protein n=1 Tax=Thalassospira sp. A3_1 TaxID=2821088 RepID=UPI001ADB624A|nr:hypothetical protein [Thalassospira sp. A3_1]MBO9507889.1 hypothetical protein [Thalassospira sp. A3_1]
MTITRTTHRSVTFYHPFRLTGHNRLFPPGIYEVETTEELDAMAATRTYKKIECRIPVLVEGSRDMEEEILIVDPAALDAALVLDADPLREEEREALLGRPGTPAKPPIANGGASQH